MDEPKKKGRKRNYKAYVRDFKAKERTLAANGEIMEEKMYTEEQFDTQYERLLNERKLEVSQGLRKTTGNITRDLIDKQAFALSVKQVESLSPEQRKGQNWYSLRSGRSIKRAYQEFKNDWLRDHPDKPDEAALYAKHMITDEFYGGSP